MRKEKAPLRNDNPGQCPPKDIDYLPKQFLPLVHPLQIAPLDNIVNKSRFTISTTKNQKISCHWYRQ